MEFLRRFESLNKEDTHLAGGKGASLGEMTQVGIPVPGGFVILSNSFERFIKETDLTQEIDTVLHGVNHKEIHTIESASEKIKSLILSREMPQDIATEIKANFSKLGAEFVAVRSSATAEDGADHAWAGQLESYLNTTEADLLDKVKHCWASLFTPRAIFYRFEKGLHNTKISVAVVVQKMVNSEISGIAFSVHPITEDYNQLIIEAGFGLGEAIVSGQITPDSYVVEKEPRQILDINVNHQKKGLYRKKGGGNEWKNIPEEQGTSQVLTKQQILDLSEIVLRVENHYGFPCDIEWAYENGTFFIVQSRPITTLSGKKQLTQQTFIKSYTRNFSIIMQQAWFAANKEGLIEKLGLTEYPYNPPYLYFMKDGVEEVWENTRANRWLLDRLIERFKSDKDFFPNIYKHYFDRLPHIEKWWNRDIKTIEELKEFLELVFLGVSDFIVLYAALMDESVPKEYKDLANAFREKDVFFAECNTAIWKALTNIYPDLGYLVVYITKEELGKNIDKNELIKRDDGFALIPGIFVGSISFTDLVQKFSKYLFRIEKGDQDQNGLRGQTAYQGKVRGLVRIVKRKDQVEQMQEGEIIVSPMTTPDMVPAMKKAVAFVTDEGGITCHAAIIAREMKKPCVIGTKVASQILKDGDEVEVDADNGIVRKISTTTTLNKFNKNDYEGLGQWVAPVLEYELWLDWSNTAESKALGIPVVMSPWISIDGHHFRPKQDAHSFIREKALQEFRAGKFDLVNAIVLEARRISKECVTAAKSIKKALSFDDFLVYFDLMRRLRFPWMSSFPLDEAATIYVKEYAANHSLDADEILRGVPHLQNSVTDDQKKLVQFKTRIKQKEFSFDITQIELEDPQLASDLRKYQKETEYIGTHHFWGEPRDIDRLLHAIDSTREEHDKQTHSTVTLPVMEVMAEVSKWRLECAQSSAQLAYALRPTMIEFAKKRNISYEDLVQLTTEEIKGIIGGGLVDTNIISERKKRFALFREDSTIHILIGEDFNTIAYTFGLNEEHEQVEQIKGSIGNKGKVKGEVVIVRRPQDNGKVKKGMILVAPETTPDFIPAMGVAAGFITDFGGITSHAAIVAREMNKPCIIGTKIASKVLKDGDIVELDADTGVIRLINSSG